MKKSPQVVVISDVQDAHIPYVQKHLSEQMIVIDPQVLLGGADVTYRFKGGRMIVDYCGTSLNNVSGVWYRKPRDILPEQLNVPEDYVTYSLAAQQNHTAMVLGAFQDATWVSDYYAIRRASNKALQLELAAKLGFRVPRTIMTSSPVRARSFIEAEKTCIVKAQSAYSSGGKNMQKSFFTTKVNHREIPDLSHMHLAPSIFQQCIDASFDVRVTVIGSSVFAAIIRSKHPDERSKIRDWRIGHYEGTMAIEPYENFPADIARMCVRLVQEFNLQYGAIDLVMDKQGELWFLENNPNGQWAFIERATSQPIGKALAALLCTSKS